MSAHISSQRTKEIPFPELVEQKYIVRRCIGKGAFGSVFLAEDKKIGRLVAIKQLIKKFSEKRGREVYERFMQEARIGAQLDHPNIINIFALEEDKKSACIIMEYLPGGSLASKIKQSGKLCTKSSIKIIFDILHGLEAAHEIMITHRDIKPQNIIFDAKDEAKISDFGIALLPYPFGGKSDLSINQQDALVGTPLYMAPEQISLAPVDARADLYSTGAVIYEMLSGRKIFDISPNAELNVFKEKILKDKVPPLNEKDLPMEMSNFVVKLIEKNPKNRFQSANEAIIALTQITEKYPSLTDNNKSNPTHSSSSSAMLEDIIRLFLVDGNMSSAERKELDRRAERLGLSQSQSRILEEKVRATIGLPSLINIEKYQKTVEKYLESAQDLVLNSDQIVELEEMRKKSKIKEDDAETILKIAIDRIEYRRRLENRRFKI